MIWGWEFGVFVNDLFSVMEMGFGRRGEKWMRGLLDWIRIFKELLYSSPSLGRGIFLLTARPYLSRSCERR